MDLDVSTVPKYPARLIPVQADVARLDEILKLAKQFVEYMVPNTPRDTYGQGATPRGTPTDPLTVVSPRLTATPAVSQPAIGTTAVSIVSQSEKRIEVLIQNTGPTTITLGFNVNPISGGVGVILGPASGLGSGDGGIFSTETFSGNIIAISNILGGQLNIVDTVLP